jgi:ubiquinone/menaquinone biosynthesis C-methylase UbiE
MSKAHNTLKIYDNLASQYDDHSLKREHLFSYARNIFTLLRGSILEVGVGTGINLQYYHPSAHLTALDWSVRMVYQARAKVRKYNLYNVEKIIVGDIMRLSNYFDPKSFNFVTSTCVFCSVPDPIIGLQEIAKILKPSGYLIQLEHGSSDFGILNLFMKPFDLLTVRSFLDS